LISFGTTAINFLPDYFYDFCIQDIFLTSTDTSFETAELIEAGSKHFDNAKITAIEETLHRIANKSENPNRDYFLSRYLSRLPLDKLKLDKSKQIIDKLGIVENRKPFESTSSISDYTTEMWLKDKGVDTSDSNIAELLKNSEELRTFNNSWLNETPIRSDYEFALDKAQVVFNKLQQLYDETDEHVKFSVLADIAQTLTIISRDVLNLKENEFKALKNIISFCYSYISDYDSSVDENASPSRGYSPTPRIVSSEALSRIVSREDSNENIELLTSAVNNSNPIIRFNAISHINSVLSIQPEYFWEIIYSRLEKENDAFVASTILKNIPSSPYDETEANRLIDIAYKKEQFFKWNNSFLDNFTLRIIWLYTTHKNELANKVLTEAYDREEFCRTVIFKAYEDFRILSLKIYSNSEFFIDSTVKWTMQYLSQVADDLKKLQSDDFKKGNGTVKKGLSLIDLIIQRIYFVFQRRKIGNIPFVQISEENANYLYFKIKPVFEKILLVSSEVAEGGLLVGHTAHYFIQTLNSVLIYDPKAVLSMVTTITKLSQQTGYTFDSMAIREVVNLTEKLLADHRELLTEKDSFNNLIDLLDIYINSGWVDALELLWKLDEIFK
jgi:hypothetical protein